MFVMMKSKFIVTMTGGYNTQDLYTKLVVWTAEINLLQTQVLIEERQCRHPLPTSSQEKLMFQITRAASSHRRPRNVDSLCT